MRLITFGTPGHWIAAFDIEGRAVTLDAAARAAGWAETGLTNRQLLALGGVKMVELAKAAATLPGEPLAGLRLGPPIPDPKKIICIGLNYHDHAREVGATPPPSPIFFAKFANSLVGPEDDLIPPRDEAHVDYEAELAVVIGRPGRYIKRADALSHVAGAMAFNDVSARDFQLANQLWTSGKAVDTFGPCGPALVTMEELGDLQDLSVQTRVNGERVQNGTTAEMIFGIAELIEFLTRVMTLEPGDIIATGTPAGVAKAHVPPRFLKPGDVVEVAIQGIGTLKNRVLEAE
ncbi:MAG: fumarylacetoacetate hydrolase family protein [Rhodobacteraceae bacterium]|nr:fumarylacetoacetate hydrolase family protein [Paracoccaceae bacterium]